MREEKGLQQLMVYVEPAGAHVTVDGNDLGMAPASVELSPGNHKVVASMEGFDNIERSFVMPYDRSMDLSLALRVHEEKAPDRSAWTAPPPPPPAEAQPEVAQPAPTPPPPGRWDIAVRAQYHPASSLSGAFAAHVDVHLAEIFSIGAGGFVTGSPSLGVFVRGAIQPFNRDGVLRPVFALEVPVLFEARAWIGVGAALGLEWRPVRMASIGLEVAAQYFFTGKNGPTPFYLFISPTVALHF
jgi:hypothetical protein